MLLRENKGFCSLSFSTGTAQRTLMPSEASSNHAEYW